MNKNTIDYIHKHILELQSINIHLDVKRSKIHDVMQDIKQFVHKEHSLPITHIDKMLNEAHVPANLVSCMHLDDIPGCIGILKFIAYTLSIGDEVYG